VTESEFYRDHNEREASELKGSFHGVIQHSFALQLPHAREFRETSGWLPHRGRQAKSSASFSARQRKYHERAHKRLRSLFEDPTGRFEFKFPVDLADAELDASQSPGPGAYSWLLSKRQARLDPQQLALLNDGGATALPRALSWAEATSGEPVSTWEGFIFAQRGTSHWTTGPERPIANDMLLSEAGAPAGDGEDVSRVLFQLWAHWRSRLFGVSLANRFFNVFLPHAILSLEAAAEHEDTGAVARSPNAEGSLLIQPFVSLVREPDRSRCRRTSTFTVLLIPILSRASTPPLEQREMSLREIEGSVRGAWGLAADRLGANRRRFFLDGPLRHYCANIEHDLPDGPLSVRQWTESMMYCTSRMRRDRLRRRRRFRSVPDDEELGDKVLTAVASSRVSAVTLVDPKLRREDVRQWHEFNPGFEEARMLPGALPDLLRAVSGRIYIGQGSSYRLDRPFLDRDYYAEVAVPVARSLITTTTLDSQERYEGSALLQSVISGYMVLGAATAQSLIRSSYHEIEAHSDPKQFGEISKEFTRDFHEIYDLDIVWESYKRTYRSILEQFEIMHDYDALHRKLEMLFDTTVAEFTEWQHTRLWFVTWLLVFVAVATIVVQVVVK
jgi:hypothetical protein